MSLYKVATDDFLAAYRAAYETVARVGASCTDPADVPWPRCVCYLSDDKQSGYAIQDAGELVCVFSTEPGRGEQIVRHAIHQGATHLNCFDGYLPTVYRRWGFVEERRETTWEETGPDVVYMHIQEGL